MTKHSLSTYVPFVSVFKTFTSQHLKLGGPSATTEAWAKKCAKTENTTKRFKKGGLSNTHHRVVDPRNECH